MKVTDCPSQTVWLAGELEMAKPLVTVTVAEAELAVAQLPLCTTARNEVVVVRLPVLSGFAVEAMSIQATPSVEDCHLTIDPV